MRLRLATPFPRLPLKTRMAVHALSLRRTPCGRSSSRSASAPWSRHNQTLLLCFETPILQVRLKPFHRVLMLSPFTFLLFLLVLGLHFITFFCSLGVHPPSLRDIGALANYQCLTWMKPIILRLFLVGLVYRGTSKGLVGSLPLRVTSSSSTSISLSSMRSDNFLLVVVRLRVGLLALACVAACASATFLTSKTLIRILACGKLTPLIHSYSYGEYPCIKHLYCFSRSCICLEWKIAVILPTTPSQSSYSSGGLRSSCYKCKSFSSR
jgi:hypothetical protein